MLIHNMNKRVALLLLLTGVFAISLIGITYAYFADKAKVAGVTVAVGSADLKLLTNLGLGPTEGNLLDNLTGPVLNDVHPNWTTDYPVKVYNNTASELALSSVANYETNKDPSELRQILFVEPFVWDDLNLDGVVDPSELTLSYGKKTIVKWKTEGFTFDTIQAGAVKGFVFRFSTQSVPESKQGATAVFDFEINSANL